MMTPHIDEGALHAYLDGALDEYPASEGERVREHLEVCGECRQRLESERDVRDRAGRILAVATPEVEGPAFEELRSSQRARAAAEVSAPRRASRLGWAASIVLAIGVGWALRGGEGGADVPTDEQAAAPPAQIAGDVRVADVEADDAVAREAVGAEALPGAQVAETEPDRAEPNRLLPSRTEVDPVTVEVASFDGITDRDEVIPDLDTGVPPLPAPALERAVVASPELVARASTAGAANDQVSDGADRGREPAEVVTSANRVSDLSTLGSFGRDEQGSEDIEDGSYSLVVPNLEVLDVRFRGGVRPEGQVVLQRLESGDTLEVIHLPPEIDPSSLERADGADREMVLQTASGWIVMRGPIAEDQLVDLMRRLLVED